MSSPVEPPVPMEIDDSDTRPAVTAGQILVVDDIAADLSATVAALAPLQRPVITATSGHEAIARIETQDFALVLLDVQMSELDGYETARRIRARDRSQHVPIIFLSGPHDDAAAARAYALGAVDVLQKPVAPEVLRAKAAVFVTLQERTHELTLERMERDFENRRRDYETALLRRERDREIAAKTELARLNDALGASDRRKDTFIAILAHELRNPLAPLRTCIDLLRADPARSVTDEMVAILDRQISALARLVEDLLDLSRIQADKIELRPERIDLVEIVENALITSRPHVDARGHALVIDVPAEPIEVIADTLRLAQVVSNLVNNAARYTPPGGRIEIACRETAEHAVIRVSDNGIGIPRELQATIFDMFVQERVGSDGSGGLGLGLALSRRLVELHGGGIVVESEGRDRGATFEVQLPRAGSPSALSARTRTDAIRPLARPRAMTTLRAIIVDDNDDARELLAELLRSHGHAVLTATDGHAGLELIRAQQPDVAIVDLGLPGLDGIALVETLRSEHPDLKTRLVALTGYGGGSDRERTRRAGFHAHLVKPASAGDILDALARAGDDDI